MSCRGYSILRYHGSHVVMCSAMDNEYWGKNGHVTVDATVNFAKCLLWYKQHHQVTKVISCRCSVDTSSMCMCVLGGGGGGGGER